MDPNVKKLWVEALRSEEYPQTRGVLHSGEGFCCLGVLCDLHSKTTGQEKWSQSGELERDGFKHPFYTYFGAETSLPHPVVEWAGLNSSNPGDKVASFANLNDNGTPFPQIADLIEKEL